MEDGSLKFMPCTEIMELSAGKYAYSDFQVALCSENRARGRDGRFMF